MPDILLRDADHRRVEAVDVALSRVSVGIVGAKCDGDWQTVKDGYRLCDRWLDERLKQKGRT